VSKPGRFCEEANGFLRDADRATKILAVPRIPVLVQALSEEVGRVAAETKHTLDSNQ
jgi:hypothetical protein